MPRRVALLTVLMTIALAACTACAAAATVRPLHAVRGAGARIEDDRGRQVLLRGVNVNQLGDYYQAQPTLTPTVQLRRSDFTQIAALGMDVVRLLVHWSALEPTPGAFDEAYVQRIRRAVGWARDAGVRVVLDMHQDAWGKYVATPAGTTCPAPLSPDVGWDGAPRWATITDGLTTCKASIRELSPAVAAAWTHFWLDTNSIQQHLVDTWARLARAFAADADVVGYDLLNEPNPGFTPGVTDATFLGSFHRRAIAAIRAAERSVPGGFAHIVFAEPSVLWSATGVTLTPLPDLGSADNIVFAPHLYAGSITLDRSLGVSLLSVPAGFDLAAQVAGLYGTTVWSGEWGWFGDPAADAANIATYAAQEDAHLWGGAWWDWRQACGDPHNISAPGGQPGAVSPSLHRYACPAQTDMGIPAGTRRVLARAYPRSAPGRLTSLRSDPSSRQLRMTGEAGAAPRSCRLDVWVPQARRPDVQGKGITGVRLSRRPGGWRVSACARGSWSVTLR